MAATKAHKEFVSALHGMAKSAREKGIDLTEREIDQEVRAARRELRRKKKHGKAVSTARR